MFPRLTRVRRSPSKVDEYVQLVESYRDDHGRAIVLGCLPALYAEEGLYAGVRFRTQVAMDIR